MRGQPTALDPVAVVDRQLQAYNDRDADAFASTYAEGARIFRAATGAVEFEGREAIRSHYRSNTFRRSGLQASVVGRMHVGDKLVVHERLSWDGRAEPLEAIVVYQVSGGLIQNAWLFEAS
jgi:hypothetical protein